MTKLLQRMCVTTHPGWHCFVDDGCLNDTRCFQSGLQKVVQKHVMVKWRVVQMSALSDSGN